MDKSLMEKLGITPEMDKKLKEEKPCKLNKLKKSYILPDNQVKESPLDIQEELRTLKEENELLKKKNKPFLREVVKVSERRETDEVFSWTGIGTTFLIIGGVAIFVFFMFFYDTSVAVNGFGTSGMRVNNIGLMHNREIGIFSGLGFIVLGAMIIAVNKLSKR